MIEKVAASSTIQITHELIELDGLLAPGDEIILYRIIQESLNNVIKHSGATNASVSASTRDGLFTLKIQDDGRGFMPGADRSRPGLGLQGIAERARMLGGVYEVHSIPSQGTSVTVRIDIKNKIR